MEWISRSGESIVLVLAVIGLLILFFRLWRRRAARYRLQKDSSGFWRYHKDTQFERQSAYGKILDQKEASAVITDRANDPKAVVVVHFNGDIRAKQHRAFAKLVDEIEINKHEIAEVVVVLQSSGGMVSQYGHGYSQMERIRNCGVPLTVCIDVVAASGGYLMALPATKIIAAPFSLVGSVGVLAFVPNVRKLLTSWQVQPRTFVAGNLKTTVGLTDEASPEQVQHFQGQLETIHRLFLAAVSKYRPQSNLEAIQTGDHWTAAEALETGLGLVDELGTSQQYLLEKNKTFDLIHITQRRSFWEEGFGRIGSGAMEAVEEKILSHANSRVGNF